MRILTDTLYWMLQDASSARSVAPTVRFRDLSDIVKRFGQPIVDMDLREQEAPLDHASAGAAPERASGSAEPPDEPHDSWENDAGLDEEIERPKTGSRDGFVVAEAEGVNLSEPILLDLLSDEPVAGVVERVAMRAKPDSSVSSLSHPTVANKFVVREFSF